MNKRNLILLICLLSLSTSVGCGQVATSPPTATPIPGWEKFEGGGIELWLPESFEGGNLEEDFELVVEGLKSLGPDFEQIAQAIEQNPSMFVLWAFDSEVSDTGFLTNMNVTTEKVSSSMTLDTYLDATINQLPPQFHLLEQGIVQLGDYQAGRLVWEAAIGDMAVKDLSYCIKDGSTMWAFGFSTSAEEFDQRLPVFEQSARSFMIQP